jgi:hypothetical protein
MLGVGARCSGGDDGPSGPLRREQRWLIVVLARGWWGATSKGKRREHVRGGQSGVKELSPRGISTAGTGGTVVTDGVRSLHCHRVRCHVHTCGDRRELFKQPWRLTSGLGSISYFQSFSVTQILKFELVSFPISKI